MNDVLKNLVIDKLPFGIYLVNRENEVVFYNSHFKNIFKPEAQSISSYFGTLTQCKYCLTTGRENPEEYSCQNCAIMDQHREAFAIQGTTLAKELVREFNIAGRKQIKHLRFQSVFLNEDTVMVVIQDLAENLPPV